MYRRVDLATSEIIACMFFRGEGEAEDRLAITDLEQRAGHPLYEARISFFRLNQVTLRGMVERVKRKSKVKRGIAYVGVGHLQGMGLLFGNCDEDATYVYLHCNYCNGSEKGCVPIVGACPLAVSNDVGLSFVDEELRKKLSLDMTVLIDASHSRSELLHIFGGDVDDANVDQANNVYRQRWRDNLVASTKI